MKSLRPGKMPVVSRAAPRVDLSAYGVLLGVALLPWLVPIWRNSVQSDIAWLMEAARRFMGGDPPSLSWYEPNPPYATVFHVPALLLEQAGLPACHAATVYFLALLLAGAACLVRALKLYPEIDQWERMLAAFLMVLFSLASSPANFGQRDMMIAWGVVPMVLVQYARTAGFPEASRRFPLVFVFGTAMALLKPPFLLLPGIMLLHRIGARKKLAFIFREPDFLCLAAGVATYAATLFLFFPDYVTVIMPDVASLYIPIQDPRTLSRALFYGAIFLIAGLAVKTLPDLPGMKAAGVLLLQAGVALIPFAMQMKGFFYQLEPALLLASMSACLFASGVLKKRFSGGVARWIGAAGVIIAMAAVYPPNYSFPSHRAFRDLELTRFMTSCPQPCHAFFIDNENAAIVMATSLYTGMTYASRFPSYWFMPVLMREEKNLDEGRPSRFTRESLDRTEQKYMAMVAGDYKRWKPDIVLIARDPSPGAVGSIDWLKKSPDFRREWQYYRPDGTLEIDRGAYFAGSASGRKHIIVFDIYRRTIHD